MQKPKGYDDVKPYVQQERLPAGGYVLKIMKAEEVKYDWGSVLLISFDVAEGECKDFLPTTIATNRWRTKSGKVRLDLMFQPVMARTKTITRQDVLKPI